jgi:hypothetical protein
LIDGLKDTFMDEYKVVVQPRTDLIKAVIGDFVADTLPHELKPGIPFRQLSQQQMQRSSWQWHICHWSLAGPQMSW